MNKWLIVMIFGLGVSGLGAEPLQKEDFSRLQKVQYAQHVVYESYLQNADQSMAGVFGFQFDTFFQPDIAGVLAIYGAVSGNRGGYGIAQVGLAKQWTLAPGLRADVRGLVGSGGGGGVAAGGGIAYQLSIGVGWEVVKNWDVEAYTGYLQFPSGSFASMVVGVGLSYRYSGLVLPF